MCSECSLEFHKVCLNYGEWVYNSKFVCSACAKKYPETAGEVITNHKINARHLPTSHLSIYLENKANAFLEECDWRQVINESHIEDKIGKIVIRVTFNQNRKFSRFNSLQSWTGSTAKGGGDSSKPNDTQADSRKTDIFNYKIKNIMAFQVRIIILFLTVFIFCYYLRLIMKKNSHPKIKKRTKNFAFTFFT